MNPETLLLSFVIILLTSSLHSSSLKSQKLIKNVRIEYVPKDQIQNELITNVFHVDVDQSPKSENIKYNKPPFNITNTSSEFNYLTQIPTNSEIYQKINTDFRFIRAKKSAIRKSKNLSTKSKNNSPNKLLRNIELWFRMLSYRSFSVINGTMAGDVGFDPLGFAITYERLDRMREIELKHARLAMIGSIGWPSTELLRDSIFTRVYHSWSSQSLFTITPRPSLTASEFVLRLLDESNTDYISSPPSTLNTAESYEKILNIADGSLLWEPEFGGFLVLLSAFEYYAFQNRRSMNRRKREPGDFGFDPLNLYEIHGGSPQAKRRMRVGEIWNGRLAMIAISIYYIIEKWTHMPLVDAAPMFFKPIFKIVIQ